MDAVINRAMSERQDARDPDVMAFADALRVAVEPIGLVLRPVRRPMRAVPAEIERPVRFAEPDTLRSSRTAGRPLLGCREA